MSRFTPEEMAELQNPRCQIKGAYMDGIITKEEMAEKLRALKNNKEGFEVMSPKDMPDHYKD